MRDNENVITYNSGFRGRPSKEDISDCNGLRRCYGNQILAKID